MATFKDAVSAAAKSEVCRIVNDPVLGLSFGLNLGPVSIGNVFIPQSTSRLLCDGNPTFTPPQPPFTGGQCTNVKYGANVTWNVNRLGQTFVVPMVIGASNGLFGPITGFQVKELATVYRFVMRNGAGQEVFLNFQSTGNVAEYSKSNWQGATPTSISINPTTPNCGNPPAPPVPPYQPTSNTYNISYEDNNGTTINTPVNLTILAPIIGSGNVVYAPIRVEAPDINLNGTVELFPDFNLNLQPSFTYAPGGNSDGAYPTPGLPYPQPSEPDGEKVIIGAVVTATDAAGGRATIISQGDNPDIFAPRLGNIAFYIRTDKGAAWTNDIPVKSVRSYIPCPVDFGAVGVAGTAESGYVLDIEPVWQYRLAPR